MPGHPDIVALRGGGQHPREVAFAQDLPTGSHLWAARLSWAPGGIQAFDVRPIGPATPATIDDLEAFGGHLLYLADVQGQYQSVVVAAVTGEPRQVFALLPAGRSASLSVSATGVQVGWQPDNGPGIVVGLFQAQGRFVSASPARLRPVMAATKNASLFIRLVEGTRRILGPAPVAWAEDAWYALRDELRSAYTAVPAPAAAPLTGSVSSRSSLGAGQTSRDPGPSNRPPAARSAALISEPVRAITVPTTWLSASGEGAWTPAGPTVTGTPVMERTFVLPDPGRPDDRIDLVWMDAGRLRFHLMAGTHHPQAASGIRGSGLVPVEEQAHLVAAFNGNFKRTQGRYSGFGFRAAGETYIPASPGLATFAVYADHRLALGAWGADIQTAPPPTDFLQNLSLILDRGKIVPEAGNASRWGITVGDSIHVWRSALGINVKGDLLYAAGPRSTALDLARVLQVAGAVRAMELDINSYWVTFNLYHHAASGRLVGTKLIPTMIRSSMRYISGPDYRDFVYVTGS